MVTSYQKKLHESLHLLVEQMIQKMEDGTGLWVKSWSAPNGFPQNFITKKKYRGFNTLYLSHIMIERGYTAPYFLTFKQINTALKPRFQSETKRVNALGIDTKPAFEKKGVEQYGFLHADDSVKDIKLLESAGFEKGYGGKYSIRIGGVKKGSKSLSVYFYKMMNYTNNEEIGEETISFKTVPLLREYKVFNIEDTEGIDYELIDTPVNDNARYKNTENFIQCVGADIRYGGASAFYCREPHDYIQVPKLEYFKDSDNYYSTLLHELTHWSGASFRCDRKKGARKGDKDYAFEELIAELGSVFLCSHLGINIENNQHPEYLQSWISSLKENPQTLWKAASAAQKAFDYVKDIAENSKKKVA